MKQEPQSTEIFGGVLAGEAIERMELIRAFEERLLDLFSRGELSGTTHTCIGQEASAFAVVGALDRERDIVFSTHRCHGHFLMYCDDVEGLMAEIMGREAGVCGGRGGSQHLYHRNFYSNGVQGGTVPLATGMALAEKMKGSGSVTVCFIGDGTLGEGAVYESLNMASLWSAPVVFVLEHNRYAQSTLTSTTTAGDLLRRAEAFGISCDRRPADDPVELASYMTELIESVRKHPKPFFQILETERLAAHSKGDDDRSQEELERIRKEDPLVRLRNGANAERLSALQAAVQERVQRAVNKAERAPVTSFDPVRQEALISGGPKLALEKLPFATNEDPSPQLVVQNLNAALHELMQESGRTIVIGEDVSDPYGGTFKVTRGLSTFFPDRVLSTPISEGGFIGLGTGLSMRGFLPIVEIMFGDFLTLGADQIVNHLAKFRWMYNDRVETPVVIRTPVGGRRGYGPTHSQCLEKMMMGIPGLITVGISRRHDPGELLRRAVLEDPRPVLFIEQKVLYAKRLESRPPTGLRFELHDTDRDALYPTGCWRPSGLKADATVVTYGAMTDIVEEAIATSFDEHEIVCEYLVPSQLSPLCLDPILDSVGRTGRLLVVEEATAPWGFGAEVIAQVSENLSVPPLVARVGAYSLPIPNSRAAEDSVLPNARRVANVLRSLVL